MAYPDYNELLSVLWGSASIEPVGTSALIASASNIFVSTNYPVDRSTSGGGGTQPIIPPIILVAPTPTTVPLTLVGAFEQSANLFNITSFDSVDGDLMSVDETGLTTVPKLRLSGLHNASALATDNNGSIIAAVLAPSAFIDTTNAFNITSGTLDAARLPVIPVGNISGLAPSATIDTTNANNISSGILAVARLPIIPTSKISGLATVATSGSYTDLINKPLLAATIAAVTNQFLTSYNAVTGLFTQAQVSAANIGGLATVATTGSYTDLTNKPVLPLNTPGVPDQVLTSYNAATGAFVMAQLAAGNITGLAVVASTGSYTDLSNKPLLAATNAFTASQFFTSYNATTGLFTKAQVATTDISGIFAPGQIPTQLPFPAGFGQAAVATQGITIAVLAASGAAATGLTVQAPTGATANYAATFMGGNVGIGTLTPKISLDFNSNLGFQVSSDKTMLYFLPNVSGRRTIGFSGQGGGSGIVLPVAYALSFSPDPNSGLLDPPTPSDVFISRSTQNVGAVRITGGASTAGSLEVTTALVATSGNNFNSGSLRCIGYYWNGTASTPDTWAFQNVLGTGTNPNSTLTLTHTGSPSNKVVIPTFLSVGTSSAPAISLDFTGASLGFSLSADGLKLYYLPNVPGRRIMAFTGAGSYSGLVIAGTYAVSFSPDGQLADPPTASDVFISRAGVGTLRILGALTQQPGNLQLGHTSSASAAANFVGGNFCSIGSYWNGAAGAADYWQFVPTLGTGTNPTSTYTLQHAGSPGAALFSIATPTKITDATAASNNAGALVVTGGVSATGGLWVGGGALSGQGQFATFVYPSTNSVSSTAMVIDLRNSASTGGTSVGLSLNASQFAPAGPVAVNALIVNARADGGTGTVGQAWAVIAIAQATSGATITQAVNFYSKSITAVGSTITNAYGLFIEAQTAGTNNNYAIFTTGSAFCSFGGNVGIGTNQPKAPLHVMNLPVYTTNALAIAGGLSAGAFYRNGADPDSVMVVH